MMNANDMQLAALMKYLRSTYSLCVTKSEAARLLTAASAHAPNGIEVRGKDVASGIPQVILVFEDEIRNIFS